MTKHFNLQLPIPCVIDAKTRHSTDDAFWSLIWLALSFFSHECSHGTASGTRPAQFNRRAISLYTGGDLGKETLEVKSDIRFELYELNFQNDHVHILPLLKCFFGANKESKRLTLILDSIASLMTG